jgi:hypothetical protein
MTFDMNKPMIIQIDNVDFFSHFVLLLNYQPLMRSFTYVTVHLEILLHGFQSDCNLLTQMRIS